MRFFSTPDLLEIGGVPFVCSGEKPTRAEAMEYYRRITQDLGLVVRLYEEVVDIEGRNGDFVVRSSKGTYRTAKVIVAIGFFDQARMMNVPGESLPQVAHYYREAHLYANQELLVIGGGNSAVIAALECHRHGARVTMAIRGETIHEGVKYWLRPDIENRVRDRHIHAHFKTVVKEIKHKSVVLKPADQISIYIGNTPAQRAYEKHGFKLLDEWPDPYFDKEIGSPGMARLICDL